MRAGRLLGDIFARSPANRSLLTKSRGASLQAMVLCHDLMIRALRRGGTMG
jgi:hypothetical protein